MSEDPLTTLGGIARVWTDLINPPMPKRLPEDQELFRVKEAARYFDVHEKTLRRMIRSGEVQTIKHGPRKTYIRRNEIIRYWRRKAG